MATLANCWWPISMTPRAMSANPTTPKRSRTRAGGGSSYDAVAWLTRLLGCFSAAPAPSGCSRVSPGSSSHVFVKLSDAGAARAAAVDEVSPLLSPKLLAQGQQTAVAQMDQRGRDRVAEIIKPTSPVPPKLRCIRAHALEGFRLHRVTPVSAWLVR